MSAQLKLVIFCFLIMSACTQNIKTGRDRNADPQIFEKAAPNKTITTHLNAIGSYRGNFGDNVITVLLNEITSDSAYGRSIVGGFSRPFAGTILSKENETIFTVKEPGDDKHDGIFTFSFLSDQPQQLTGSWSPYDTAVTSPKQFSLAKKMFKYDTTAGRHPEASSRLLKAKDVENLDKWDLSYMRNEIFARHGYSFSRKETRSMFEEQDWYVPNSVDVTNDLTELEKKNIALILRYEKYAKEYGDDYGR